MDLLTRIKKAREAATQGKWELTLGNPEGFPDLFLNAEKTIDFTYRDMDFIDLAANHILDLVRAYEVLRDAVNYAGENSVEYDVRSECLDALAKADAILNGGKDE